MKCFVDNTIGIVLNILIWKSKSHSASSNRLANRYMIIYRNITKIHFAAVIVNSSVIIQPCCTAVVFL